MITKKDIEQIRKLLDGSKRPLIFYDDDADGLCSYLLFSKYLNRGKGIILKSTPMLTRKYLYKVEEYSPDLLIVLDKPEIDQDFIDEVKIPILWIDHHPIVKRERVKYFNPRSGKNGESIPTSYICYKAVDGDLWLGFLGTMADWFLPKDITKKFIEKYPDLYSENVKDPGQAIYGTKIGELARIFTFSLMGGTSDVNKYVNALRRIETPYEILNKETPAGRFIYKKYQKTIKIYNKFLGEAIESAAKKDTLIVYTYNSGKYSFTGELANEMIHRFPKRVILIGRAKGDRLIMSLRGYDVDLPGIIKDALVDVDGYGGGHMAACGGNIPMDDLGKFVSRLKKKL